MDKDERDAMKEAMHATMDMLPDETLRLSFYVAALQALSQNVLIRGPAVPAAHRDDAENVAVSALLLADAALRAWRSRDGYPPVVLPKMLDHAKTLINMAHTQADRALTSEMRLRELRDEAVERVRVLEQEIDALKLALATHKKDRS